jgi:hypothetical protein
MSKALVYVGLVALALGLVCRQAGAAPLQQDGGIDGIVSVEAEHFDENVMQSNAQWKQVGPTGGFTGVAGMQVTGLAQINEGYAATSPRLDYQISFVKTGTHRLASRLGQRRRRRLLPHRPGRRRDRHVRPDAGLEPQLHVVQQLHGRSAIHLRGHERRHPHV